MTERESFQLMTKRKMMLAIMVTEFLSRNVKLLLTADFAWLMSLPSLLTNYPDLYCSKKYMSFLMNLA